VSFVFAVSAFPGRPSLTYWEVGFLIGALAGVRAGNFEMVEKFVVA